MKETRTRGGTGALLCLALFCSTVMLMAVAGKASAVSMGVVWSDDTDNMEVVGKSGASLLRVEFTPAKSGNGSSWSHYDEIFGNAAQNGMTVLPLMRGRLNGGSGLPTSGEKAAYTEWLEKVVRRYGYNGGYWNSHSQIPAHPVIGWEIWNEPNNPSFGSITATEYGTFLSWAGPAVQTTSESWGGQKTGVLFAGLLATNRATGYQNYLETAYKAAGSSSFTGVGFHPYELDPSKFPKGETRFQAFRGAVVGLRSFLNNAEKMPNASGKSIWVTEIGWPTDGAEYGVEESEQASLLSESFNWAKGEEAAEKALKAIVWYTVKDISTTGWQYRCGLRRVDGSYRSSWFAFQEATGAPRWPNPGPKLKVAYSDAADANSMSVWQAGPESGWQQTFLWGHEIAAGSSPAALMINGTPNVFYVDAGNNNTITDWTWNPTTGWQQTSFYGHQVAKGTNPVAIMNNGVPTVFFVDASDGNTVSEWTWNSTSGWQQTFFYGHTVAAGTSPSAVAINGTTHVFYVDATYGNTITDWTWNSTTGWQQAPLWGHPLSSSTSPSAFE
jgi:hypothetical protein